MASTESLTEGPMFNDAKDVVSFVDGHVSYIRIYWQEVPGELCVFVQPASRIRLQMERRLNAPASQSGFHKQAVQLESSGLSDQFRIRLRKYGTDWHGT